MTISNHCAQRLQQRGIPQMVLELLSDFGSAHRSSGADCLMFDKAAIKRLRRHMGGARGLLPIEPWLHVYAVIADDGIVVTVGHRHRRLRRH